MAADPDRFAPRGRSETMFETILLATDGSQTAASAAETAISMADRFEATVHALYVIDSRRVADEFDPIVEKAEVEAETTLDAVERAAASRRIGIDLHLRRGLPHEHIVDAIGDYGADLVVLGATGRSGLDRIIGLGSVAERVIRRSPVHVMVAPFEREAEQGATPPNTHK